MIVLLLRHFFVRANIMAAATAEGVATTSGAAANAGGTTTVHAAREAGTGEASEGTTTAMTPRMTTRPAGMSRERWKNYKKVSKRVARSKQGPSCESP